VSRPNWLVSDEHVRLVDVIKEIVDTDGGLTKDEILARVIDDYGDTDRQHVGIALKAMVRHGQLRLDDSRYFPIAEEEG